MKNVNEVKLNENEVLKWQKKKKKSEFNEKAKQGLNLFMRLNTKLGFVKGHNSHLCILGLERKREMN